MLALPLIVLPSNIIMFIGIFIIAEAIFSIIYYFDGSPLPHTFRALRAIFGLYLVYRGARHSIFKTTPDLIWVQITFFIIIGLSILAGYEVAKVLERGKEGKSEEEN